MAWVNDFLRELRLYLQSKRQRWERGPLTDVVEDIYYSHEAGGRVYSGEDPRLLGVGGMSEGDLERLSEEDKNG